MIFPINEKKATIDSMLVIVLIVIHIEFILYFYSISALISISLYSLTKIVEGKLKYTNDL
jgi:membrane-anchored glycerophosphoryl diester phosphodiesterase (GDPDase)